MAKARRRPEATPPVEEKSQGPSQWLVLTYVPVSLFSLRSTFSMSKGGKTLLLPTPYAVKMAMIDGAFRQSDSTAGESLARSMFHLIKARRIRFRPPGDCVVQNTFVKIRQEERGGDAGQYVPTIAYRELVFYAGNLAIAIDASAWSESDVAAAIQTAAHINYFGKRGSFFQFTEGTVVEQLPTGFTIAQGDPVESLPMGVYGVTQFLDDFGPDLCKDKDGFERISTYHDKDIKIGKHRILVSTLVPYQQVQATRSFTRYRTKPMES